MKHADLLIEIHTGELPPKQLLALADAFLESISQRLTKLQFTFTVKRHFATPRRLAVLLTNVIEQQPDQEVLKRGPTLQAAFDQNNQPTKATLGFLRSLSIS